MSRESEAIKDIRMRACNDRYKAIHCTDDCKYGEDKCPFQIAMDALEEIQRYRAIGTVEEIQLLVSKGRAYDQVACERDIAIEQLAEVGLSFGQKTDDVRIAVERMKPKKVVNKKGFIIAKDKGGNEFYEANPYCPSCNTPIDNGGTAKGVYCKWCGQRFDWSE